MYVLQFPPQPLDVHREVSLNLKHVHDSKELHLETIRIAELPIHLQPAATDIFITPPNSYKLTDKDSDDKSEPVPDNFSRRQLLAEAEVREPASESVDEPPNRDHIFQETNQQNTRREKKNPLTIF
ncbi:hypothetical protein ILUMI_27526 [Ignelater luminosus]|uniref:Uncharacterized protein n=1 Tax=Ignelater luminosus TaxID=2038154 RepID=A0A8K0C3G6_IGNLU|nr:hypothetical protein ILUMI_27526 [Ignelater luminosus]